VASTRFRPGMSVADPIPSSQPQREHRRAPRLLPPHAGHEVDGSIFNSGADEAPRHQGGKSVPVAAVVVDGFEGFVAERKRTSPLLGMSPANVSAKQASSLPYILRPSAMGWLQRCRAPHRQRAVAAAAHNKLAAVAARSRLVGGDDNTPAEVVHIPNPDANLCASDHRHPHEPARRLP
jgi:hypothetical protein